MSETVPQEPPASESAVVAIDTAAELNDDDNDDIGAPQPIHWENGDNDMSRNDQESEGEAVPFLGDIDNIDFGNENGDNDNLIIRLGTTSSARFNILSTMVGGGSLSLPFAFAKSGNALVGPILLILIACLSEFCFRIMVQAVRILSYQQTNLGTTTKVGADSFEKMAAAAFGPRAYIFSMALVTSMCFFGTVGYAVLLRDMLEPITVAMFGPQKPGPSWPNNATLWLVVLAVTPLCTLQTLTSLKRFGAASMFSVLILGICIVFRSTQCNLFTDTPDNDAWTHWTDSFRLFPESWWDVLDAFPLYISCYVCHYNILTVHNELRQPTVTRVNWWLRSTTWAATLFYLVMGVAGSAYGAKCTTAGHVQGNVLLDFDNSDPLLLIGRMCLAVTITLAFPMLTIPARDIVLRSIIRPYFMSSSSSSSSARSRPLLNDAVAENDTLQEPLLSETTATDEEEAGIEPTPTQPPVSQSNGGNPSTEEEEPRQDNAPFSLGVRLVVAMVLLWSATALASVVSSIDVVWDLLGSSLSILLSVLIPAASFLVLTHPSRLPLFEQESTWSVVIHHLSRIVSWTLLVLFVPLMFLSTLNAVYHTFFEKR